MKKGFRTCCTVLCAAVLTSLSLMPVSANSAQRSWSGVSPTGTLIRDGQSPVEVEKEVLTFDLNDFPSTYFETLEEYLDYSASVSAEYTFYNPSDAVITATLVFPFGHEPFYAFNTSPDTGEYRPGADTEKFDITINGEPIEKTIRYTYTDEHNFNVNTDLSRLTDGYADDDFFSPDLPVTRYTYEVSGADFEENEIINALLTLPKDAGTRRYFCPELNSGSPLEKEDNLGFFISESTTSFSFFCFGEPLEKEPAAGLYPDYVYNPEPDRLLKGSVTLQNTESMSFEDFVFSAYAEYPENSEIMKEDWYNAVLAELEASKFDDEETILLSARYYDANYDFTSRLMRWYEYNITLNPGEHLVNTVTAPVYPGIDTSYTSFLYTYGYLLSPASMWKKFGTFEAQIHTSAFLIEPDELMQKFEKTDFGYSYTQEGLPDGEMNFTLSSSENPSYIPEKPSYTEEDRQNDSESVFWIVLLSAGAVLCIAIPVGLIILAVCLLRKKKSSKNKNKKS